MDPHIFHSDHCNIFPCSKSDISLWGQNLSDEMEDSLQTLFDYRVWIQTLNRRTRVWIGKFQSHFKIFYWNTIFLVLIITEIFQHICVLYRWKREHMTNLWFPYFLPIFVPRFSLFELRKTQFQGSFKEF